MILNCSQRVFFFFANGALINFFFYSTALHLYGDFVLAEQVVDIKAKLVSELVQSQFDWISRCESVALEASKNVFILLTWLLILFVPIWVQR